MDNGSCSLAKVKAKLENIVLCLSAQARVFGQEFSPLFVLLKYAAIIIMMMTTLIMMMVLKMEMEMEMLMMMISLLTLGLANGHT